jgi:hypothetical protein
MMEEGVMATFIATDTVPLVGEAGRQNIKIFEV